MRVVNDRVLADFLRLTKGLRAMVLDFAEVKRRGSYGDDSSAILQDDANILAANLITSQHRDDANMHRVVLDIDHDAALIPSSTPGHFHLLIDVNMPWDKYSKLLDALAEAGVIEDGYAGASKAKKYSAIRTPWTVKDQRDGFEVLEGIL